MKKNHTTPRSPRGGYLYIGVLVTAMIVSIIGFASMTVARMQLRNATLSMDDELVRGLAQSGIELGISQINNDPSWQTNITHGVELPAGGVAVNGGTMHWQLDNNGSSGKLLTGIGRKGDAEVRLQVSVSTGGSTTVEAPLLVGGALWIGNFTTTETLNVNGGPIRCNSTITNWGNLTGDLEAQEFSNSGTYSGTSTVPSAVHDLPDPQTVFDYYVAEGTLIPNGPLDNGLGGLSLNDVLLSPSSNPYGSPDPDGIYVINAAGKSLSIQTLRVVGTLVVINGGDTTMKKEVNFEPAYSNYPSLMVDGDLEITINDASLSESDRAINFNPVGTPWQGNTDSDQSDSYPSRMAGVIYCSSNLIIGGKNANNAARFNGVVICDGNVIIEKLAEPSFDLDAIPGGNPPPGFGVSSSGQITPGTWKRIASP